MLGAPSVMPFNVVQDVSKGFQLGLLPMYRRSPHFVIFGTKRVSRNSGITNFETLFSTKIPNWVQNFSKVPIFNYFSQNYQGYFYIFIKLFMKILKQMLKRYNNNQQGTGSPPLVRFLLVRISNQYGFLKAKLVRLETVP